MKKFIALLTLLATPCFAQHYVGDYAPGATVCRFFSTYQPSTGAAFALASGAVDVYQEGSDTQDTDDSGATLTASVDSVAGMNRICVDTSTDGTFYAAGRMISVVLTAGTVDSVSVAGTPILSFSLNKEAALKPTTAGRTLDVSAGGEAGLDWANIGSPTTAQNLSGTNIDTDQAVASVAGAVGSVTGDIGGIAPNGLTLDAFNTDANPLFGILRRGTAQSAGATDIVLDSGAAFGDDTLIGATVVACGSTQGYCQSRLITDYAMSTDTATVETWPVTPSGTITYYLFGSAPSTGGGGLDAAGVRAAVGLASANLDTQLGTIDDFLDTEIAAILADTNEVQISLAAGGLIESMVDDLQSEVDGIQADTEDLQNRVPAALVGGRIDATVDGTGMEAGAVTAIQSGLATAAAQATAQADLDLLTGTDGVTLATSQPNYAPATAAALATVDGNVDEALTRLPDASPGATGGLPVLDANGNVQADAEYMNGVPIQGSGTLADPWNGE